MTNEKNTFTRELDPVSQTIRAYDQITSDYAETWFNDPVMGPSLHNFLNCLDKNGCVLDVGCGPGRDVLAMVKAGIEAVGVDLSSVMVSEARKRVSGAIFRRMDQRHLMYPPETFDGIWSCAALHHLPKADTADTLREFARTLKIEGLLCAIIKEGSGECFDQIGRYQGFYTATEFRKLVVAAGFEVISESTSFSDKGTLGKNPKKWFHILARKIQNLIHTDDELESLCHLCPFVRFNLNRQIGIPSCGAILWGDNNLYVVPDIAPLMDGHLLLVSILHNVCFGACPDKLIPDIRANQQKIRQMFRKAYGQATTFLEHGPVHPREAGACISHAHFHCLPTSLPIREVVERSVGQGQRATLEALQHLYHAGQSYLYVEEDTGDGWAYPVSVTPSQILRQATVVLLGHDNWQWQTSYKIPESHRSYQRSLEHLLPIADELNLH